MQIRMWRSNSAVRMLVAGAAAGAVILGLGGRIAMAAIQAASNTTPSRFTVGGTLTVIGLGLASGLGGALMAFVSRWLARRLPPAYHSAQYLLLALMLWSITMRGLRGTAPVSITYFVPLVVVYAVGMIWLDRRLTPAAAG